MVCLYPRGRSPCYTSQSDLVDKHVGSPVLKISQYHVNCYVIAFPEQVQYMNMEYLFLEICIYSLWLYTILVSQPMIIL